MQRQMHNVQVLAATSGDHRHHHHHQYHNHNHNPNYSNIHHLRPVQLLQEHTANPSNNISTNQIKININKSPNNSSSSGSSNSSDNNNSKKPAIRFRPGLQLLSPMEAATRALSPAERVERMVAENAVVVFSVSSCCMCHVAKKLFCGMGVSPSIVELDEEPGGADMQRTLTKLMMASSPGTAASAALPAVFVGGKLIGGLDRLMACHISGALIPKLKDAGALWL